MAKPFKNLVEKMSPVAQERAKAKTREMLLEMNLQELRQHCTDLTQEDVAELLDVTQAYVSKFEHRGNVLVANLFAYVEALGGELEIRARFPGKQDVRVTQFDKIIELAEAAEGHRRHG
jgi:transcriptional regulator with XRE-family HTH domain